MAAEILRREMRRDPAFALDDNPHCEDCVRFREAVTHRYGRHSVRVQGARTEVGSIEGVLEEEDFRLSAPLWAVSEESERGMARVAAAGIRSPNMTCASKRPASRR